jgi:hypothetical protein
MSPASTARLASGTVTDSAAADAPSVDPPHNRDAPVDSPAAAPPSPDLDAIERDLDAVEAALARLADGTYRTDEITGESLPVELLDRDPTARRA